MRRREFITLLGGAAATWPIAGHAQQPDRARHIGVLVGFDDPGIKVFQDELEKLGWWEGSNIHIDRRYAPAGAQVMTLANGLVALQSEVIFAQTRPVTAALQRATKPIPIVFIMVYEPGVVGKWLEMLKEIAPQTARVALLGNPKTAVYYDYLLQAAEAAAPSLGIEVLPSRIENDAADIEHAIATFATEPNGSMVVLPDSTTNISKNSDLIIALAARNRIPAIYSNKYQVPAGGLMSYGIVGAEQYRQAASYVDRILRGAKASDLPVHTHTKYETALNLKTAKDLGLTVPTGLLVAANEVVE